MILRSAHFAFGFAIAVALLGCSSAGAEVQPPSIEEEDAFNRTTNCVHGALPVEIRYALLGKPTLVYGDDLAVEAVGRVTNELDVRIAVLLEAAMRKSWKLSTAEQQPWSPSFYSLLENHYVAEIAEQAPKLLQIEFCGERNQVGGAVVAAIADYFSRSVRRDDGQQPAWLEALGSRGVSKGTSIIMIAVGLQLAKIDFQPELLAKAAAK